MSDELNYVVAETEKGRKIVLECDTCEEIRCGQESAERRYHERYENNPCDR